PPRRAVRDHAHALVARPRHQSIEGGDGGGPGGGRVLRARRGWAEARGGEAEGGARGAGEGAAGGAVKVWLTEPQLHGLSAFGRAFRAVRPARHHSSFTRQPDRVQGAAPA